MRAIRYALACFVAIVIAVAIMKFVGVTWKDIDYFFNYGVVNALKLFYVAFHNSVGTSPF